MTDEQKKAADAVAKKLLTILKPLTRDEALRVLGAVAVLYGNAEWRLKDHATVTGP